MSVKALTQQMQALPTKPGVYFFKDSDNKVLYVGKAVSLRDRVRSYFTPQSQTPKILKMISRADNIDSIITNSEHEALILESSLIKKHQPYFNVRLKDDKSYPFIKIGMRDDWPRAHLTRRVVDDGSRYFGPFASARSIRKTLNLLNKIFPFRTCKNIPTGPNVRPCLKYHIHRCVGPCTGKASTSEYKEIITQVKLFLEGKQEKILEQLQGKMADASDSLEFEKALLFRDQISAIERIMTQQQVFSPRKTNEDVIAIARDKIEACAQVFFIRNGKLIGKEHFTLEGVQDEDPGQVMTSFLEQFYNTGAEIPPRILIQTPVENPEPLEQWLESKRGRRVHLLNPRRGSKKNLVDMVAENALEALKQLRVKKLLDTGRTAAALAELKTSLLLPRLPRRMECYDISNIRGTAAVGSMVVFEEGQPKSSHYRRFNIKTVTGSDDYAMMQEVLLRRFGRVRKNQKNENQTWGVIPDLVIIDGGRGHLNAALEVMKSLNFENIPVISIAKEYENVFIPAKTKPIILPRNSQGLYLLQRIRDEAHRFALAYHTNVRKRAVLTSGLEAVPGIGASRRRALLKKFGSVKSMRNAPIDDLILVPGISKALAITIKDYL